MAERQGRRQSTFEVPAEEVVGRYAEIERRFGRVIDDGRAVFLGEREHAEDAAPTVSVKARVNGSDPILWGFSVTTPIQVAWDYAVRRRRAGAARDVPRDARRNSRRM